MTRTRTTKRIVALLATTSLAMTLFAGAVSAETSGGLNGIGSQQQPTTQQVAPDTPVSNDQTSVQTTTEVQTTTATDGNESGASAVGSLFENVGVDQEASQKASSYMQPIAKTVNFIFAIILFIATLGMFLITALDLLYIAVPPVRRLLYAGQPQGGGGGGMMGGGFGGGMGMGGGMGGYGGGMMGGGGMASQPQQSSFLGRWISDEAVSAVAHLEMGQQGGGMGGGMMGGFGGGMMGGGMAQEPPKTKSVILDYLKKRIFFLAVFGVCAVLLSTTIFTDLGVKLGTWILNRLIGIENDFPA